MSILLSKKELVDQIEALAEVRNQSPEEIVAEAVAAYVTEMSSPDDGFWESIIGMENSGDPTFAARDEEILHEETDPIHGWETGHSDTDSNRH